MCLSFWSLWEIRNWSKFSNSNNIFITSVEALEKSLIYKILVCGIWRVIQRNRGTKTTATDLQIQNTEKLLQQIYKYKVLLCAEIRWVIAMLVIVQRTLFIISFSKKRPKCNKCCHLNFVISCVFCLTHVVLVALVMTIEMEHCDVVHLCVC